MSCALLWVAEGSSQEAARISLVSIIPCPLSVLCILVLSVCKFCLQRQFFAACCVSMGALQACMTSTLSCEWGFGKQLQDLTLSCCHLMAQGHLESNSPTDHCCLPQLTQCCYRDMPELAVAVSLYWMLPLRVSRQYALPSSQQSHMGAAVHSQRGMQAHMMGCTPGRYSNISNLIALNFIYCDLCGGQQGDLSGWGHTPRRQDPMFCQHGACS